MWVILMQILNLDTSGLGEAAKSKNNIGATSSEKLVRSTVLLLMYEHCLRQTGFDNLYFTYLPFVIFIL